MKKRVLGLVFTFGLVNTLLSGARASPADRADVDARKHFEEGNKGFSLGEFDRAVREYKAAYGAKSDAVFLYHIAEAYRLGKQPAQAQSFYRAFLRESPSASNRNEIEALIHELEIHIEQEVPATGSPVSAASPDMAKEVQPSSSVDSKWVEKRVAELLQQDAARCVAPALALLAEGKFYQAKIEIESAPCNARAVIAVLAKIEAAQQLWQQEEPARLAKAREQAEAHIDLAKKAIHKNDVDTAYAELDRAKELGADVVELREAVEKTPAARKRAAEARREEERRGREKERLARIEQATARRIEKELPRVWGGDAPVAIASRTGSTHSLPEWILLGAQQGKGGCREASLNGTIVQRMAPKVYEVILRLPMGLWGAGNDDNGKALHVILRTSATGYETDGEFSDLCIFEKYAVRKITLSNGFARDWVVFAEDPRPRQ